MSAASSLPPEPTTTTTRTGVRRCAVLAADGTVSSTRTVFCPRRSRSEPIERCCGCAHMQGVEVAADGEHGAVSCAVEPSRPSLDRVDLRETAAATRMGSVLRDDVHCVREDVSLDRAAAMMREHDVTALAVVDPQRRLRGVLSREALLGDRPAHEVTVGEVMRPLLYGVPEEAPLAYAISLMACERLSDVPAVSRDGEVVGMLAAVDALRWVARALGYEVPTSGDTDTHSH